MITIEMLDAKGEDGEAWARAFAHDHQKDYGMSYRSNAGMGDSPMIDLDHWSAAEEPVAARIAVTEHGGKIYLVSLWMPRLTQKNQTVNRKTFDVLLNSWRWLEELP